MASNDIALFLDLDNLVIGARDANLHFDAQLLIDQIKERTGGRVVVRRAYTGNLRQDHKLMKELAAAGFTMQSAVTLNNYGKNLIDMYMVVDAMDTLVDGQEYSTYVLATGDRDFVPLVHTLRRRGKHVIGIGLHHTTSGSLTSLCDEYIYYEDLLPAQPLAEQDVEAVLAESLGRLVQGDERVRASVLKEKMIELSNGQFGRFQYSDTSFSKFLGNYPHLVVVERDGTTTYVRQAGATVEKPELYPRYRTALKRQKLRVVPPRERLTVMRDLIELLDASPEMMWRDVVGGLAGAERENGQESISRNAANAMLVLARRGGVIRTLKGKTLATAPVLLALEGPKVFQEAIIRCDAVYLQAIQRLSDPFDMEQAALAIYDSATYVPYMERVQAWLDSNPLDAA